MNDGAQDPPSRATSEERTFAVQNFTARYDPIEDRICLHAVDATCAKQAIYLTRRLMDQIIPVVTKHLEEKTPKGVPGDVVQSMTQERMRQARKAEPPAQPERWSQKFGPVVKVDRMTRETIRDDKEKDAFA